MKKNETPRVLRYAGFMGHEFVVIEPGNHWTSVDGWQTIAHVNSLESAKLACCPGCRVYRRIGPGQWAKVYSKRRVKV